jgi:hypothetical protein
MHPLYRACGWFSVAIPTGGYLFQHRSPNSGRGIAGRFDRGLVDRGRGTRALACRVSFRITTARSGHSQIMIIALSGSARPTEQIRDQIRGLVAFELAGRVPSYTTSYWTSLRCCASLRCQRYQQVCEAASLLQLVVDHFRMHSLAAGGCRHLYQVSTRIDRLAGVSGNASRESANRNRSLAGHSKCGRSSGCVFLGSTGRISRTPSWSAPQLSNCSAARTDWSVLRHLNPRPPEGSGLNLIVAECVRKPSDSLVFTGNRVVRCLQLYVIVLGQIEMN